MSKVSFSINLTIFLGPAPFFLSFGLLKEELAALGWSAL